MPVATDHSTIVELADDSALVELLTNIKDVQRNEFADFTITYGKDQNNNPVMLIAGHYSGTLVAVAPLRQTLGLAA